MTGMAEPMGDVLSYTFKETLVGGGVFRCVLSHKIVILDHEIDIDILREPCMVL